MQANHTSEPDIVHTFIKDGCRVVQVHDPADTQKIIYGTVENKGGLVGSFYCADPHLQRDWQIITGLGPLTHERRTVRLDTADAAIHVLTNVLTARDSFELEQRLDVFMHDHAAH